MTSPNATGDAPATIPFRVVDDDEIDGNQQESYGVRLTRSVTRVVEVTVEKLKDSIAPVVDGAMAAVTAADASASGSGWRLEKVKLKLGVSAKGDVYVVSAGIDAGIELEFVRGG